jgi:hypothetical protein
MSFSNDFGQKNHYKVVFNNDFGLQTVAKKPFNNGSLPRIIAKDHLKILIYKVFLF